MRLRRSGDGSTAGTTATGPELTSAWDGLPAKPAGEVVIRAPKAGELVAPVAPVRAA
jgi:hypothetical protein